MSPSHPLTLFGRLAHFLGRAITPALGRLGWRRESAEMRRREKIRHQLETERCRLLIEKALDIITIIDINGTITFESPSIRTTLGYRPDELIGRRVFDLIHPDDHQIIIGAAIDAFTTPGMIRRLTVRFLHADGSWRSIESIGTNLTTDPAINGFIINSRDVTERITMEKELEQLLELVEYERQRLEIRVEERTAEVVSVMRKLEIASQTQKRFIADASHDLRTPLTVLRAEIDLLLRGNLEPAMRLTLESLNQQTERLDNLTGDLLILATLEGRESSAEFQPTRLDELMMECASQLGGSAAARGIIWHVDCDEPIELECDQISIKRMLCNLIDNAVKYSDTGGTVSLRLQKARETNDGGATGEAHELIEFIISDTGAGIAAEDLPHVFDRFYRGDLTRSMPGTGLGLAIVKAVADAHGGTISVDSAAGVGTTITTRLPLRAM